MFLSFLAIRSNRLKENALEAMSNAEDIVEVFPTLEADQVAGLVSLPLEYVTSKQLKVRTLQWSPIAILIFLCFFLFGSINSGNEF
ncbi:hypothetical protein NL676_021263 [Syzygium grande]|nr:hypothetical protein NL676_021263 [Syzygium grande]